MYKLVKNNFPGSTDIVLKLEGQVSIPCVTGNRDYQEYLEWLAEGNEPLPADE